MTLLELRGRFPYAKFIFINRSGTIMTYERIKSYTKKSYQFLDSDGSEYEKEYLYIEM